MDDGLILAEGSLAEIPLLVTSDKHLLDIDETALRLAFHDADLLPVSPVHPRRLEMGSRKHRNHPSSSGDSKTETPSGGSSPPAGSALFKTSASRLRAGGQR